MSDKVLLWPVESGLGLANDQQKSLYVAHESPATKSEYGTYINPRNLSASTLLPQHQPIETFRTVSALQKQPSIPLNLQPIVLADHDSTDGHANKLLSSSTPCLY